MEIIECFTEYCEEVEHEDATSESGQGMSLDDKMSLWEDNFQPSRALSYDAVELVSGVEEHEPLGVMLPNEPKDTREEDSSAELPELRAYRDFIFHSTAYEWLLESLRKEIALQNIHPNRMEEIRISLLEAMPPTKQLSRWSPPDMFSVTFDMNWEIIEFLDAQDYAVSGVQALGQALTLTGSVTDAQALPAAEYMRQTWPTTASPFLELLQSAISDKSQHHTSELRSSQALQCIQLTNVR